MPGLLRVSRRESVRHSHRICMGRRERVGKPHRFGMRLCEMLDVGLRCGQLKLGLFGPNGLPVDRSPQRIGLVSIRDKPFTTLRGKQRHVAWSRLVPPAADGTRADMVPVHLGCRVGERDVSRIREIDALADIPLGNGFRSLPVCFETVLLDDRLRLASADGNTEMIGNSPNCSCLASPRQTGAADPSLSW